MRAPGFRGALMARSAIPALAGLLLAAPAALAETPVAGVMAGALSVDETGSAGYTLPIAVPPGIAGLQPEVALTHSLAARMCLLSFRF